MIRNVFVQTAPASKRLTDVNDVRDQITGIPTSDSAAAAYLGTLIDQASQRIIEYLGYDLARAGYEEKIKLDTRVDRITLAHPVDVSINATAEQSASLNLSPLPALEQFGPVLQFADPLRTDRLYIFDYDAGYATSSDRVTGCPNDIQQACILLVAQAWLTRGRAPDVEQESFGGFTTVEYSTARSMPPVVMNLLDPYRRITV